MASNNVIRMADCEISGDKSLWPSCTNCRVEALRERQSTPVRMALKSIQRSSDCESYLLPRDLLMPCVCMYVNDMYVSCK